MLAHRIFRVVAQPMQMKPSISVSSPTLAKRDAMAPARLYRRSSVWKPADKRTVVLSRNLADDPEVGIFRRILAQSSQDAAGEHRDS